jgi:VIT1/CCC1 family predicted Fe2+/Mn2+ transporter
MKLFFAIVVFLFGVIIPMVVTYFLPPNLRPLGIVLGMVLGFFCGVFSAILVFSNRK